MPWGAEAAQYWDTWDDAQVAVSELCPGVGAHVPQTGAQPFLGPIPQQMLRVPVPQRCHGTERQQLLVALWGGVPGTAAMRTQLGKGTERVFLAQPDSLCPL